jgi:hypothetical protein
MSMDHEVLERKNEMLRRKIQTMLLRENKRGLSSQDQFLKNSFIRELYSNNYQLNHS